MIDLNFKVYSLVKYITELVIAAHIMEIIESHDFVCIFSRYDVEFWYFPEFCFS